MAHCNTHQLKTVSLDYDETESSIKEQLITISQKLNSFGIKPELGDLIEFVEESGYRNDGIYIWDGQKAIELDREPDDYGTLPQMFRVIEPTIGADGSVRTFPLRYWHDVFGEDWRGIDHNEWVWFDHRPRQDELLRNLRYDNQLFPGKWALYTSLVYNNKTYYIVFLYQLDIRNDTLDIYHFKDGGGGSHPPAQKKQLNQLMAAGYSANDALKMIGCEPDLINDETYELLRPELIEKTQHKFRTMLSSNELIPFDCGLTNDYYGLTPEQNNILYCF